MNKFLKENWFKLLVVGALFFIAFSIAYYFVVFLPNKPLSSREEMDMRLQCQNMAKKYFDDRDMLLWDKDRDSFKSHYYKKINKCFIEIDASVSAGRSEITLYDVVDNKQYGEYLELTGDDGMYPVSPDGKVKPYLCVVSEKKCKNQDEFETLVKPYMEE